MALVSFHQFVPLRERPETSRASPRKRGPLEAPGTSKLEAGPGGTLKAECKWCCGAVDPHLSNMRSIVNEGRVNLLVHMISN